MRRGPRVEGLLLRLGEDAEAGREILDGAAEIADQGEARGAGDLRAPPEDALRAEEADAARRLLEVRGEHAAEERAQERREEHGEHADDDAPGERSRIEIGVELQDRLALLELHGHRQLAVRLPREEGDGGVGALRLDVDEEPQVLRGPGGGVAAQRRLGRVGRAIERGAGDEGRGALEALLGEGAEVRVGDEDRARADQRHRRDDRDEEPEHDAPGRQAPQLERLDEHRERLEGRALEDLEHRLPQEHVVRERGAREDGHRQDEEAHGPAAVQPVGPGAGGQHQAGDERRGDEEAHRERGRELGEQAEGARLDLLAAGGERADEGQVPAQRDDRGHDRRRDRQDRQRRADREDGAGDVVLEDQEAGGEERHHEEGADPHERLARDDPPGKLEARVAHRGCSLPAQEPLGKV